MVSPIYSLFFFALFIVHTLMVGINGNISKMLQKKFTIGTITPCKHFGALMQIQYVPKASFIINVLHFKLYFIHTVYLLNLNCRKYFWNDDDIHFSL